MAGLIEDKQLTIDELFTQAKAGIGIYVSYQDKTLRPYFNDVVKFILNAGVSEDTVLRESSVGLISRGLSDLWQYGAGEGRLSEYFKERAVQMTLQEGVSEDGV